MRKSRKESPVLTVVLVLVSFAPALDAGAQVASVNVVNSSSYDFYEMYLSPSYRSQWGRDQLGEFVLESGFYFPLSGMGCGNYDFKLVDEDGDECVIFEVYLCGDMGDWVFTDDNLLDCEGYGGEATASATIVNSSNYDIYNLFISPTGGSQWGPDQLGEYVLASGRSYTVNDIDCGDYDIKMVDEDGDECVIYQVYLCGEEHAVVTDHQLLECEGY